MIEVTRSATADTRTCDVSKVTIEQLGESSRRHIADVGKALAFFSGKLTEAASVHDYDKLTELKWFHDDFKTDFERTGWWDNHRRIHRHHLTMPDGVPEDVNLLDVLEYVADCVMAGMARSGQVYDLEMPPELLARAFRNTVDLLKAHVVLEEEAPGQEPGGKRESREEGVCPNCEVAGWVDDLRVEGSLVRQRCRACNYEWGGGPGRPE